jgi:amino acid transporter
MVQSGLALLLALTGSFVELAMLSIIARMVTYVGTVAALPVLRKRFGGKEGSFRLPGGNLIIYSSLGLCLIFLISATLANLIAGAIALLLGWFIYSFRSRK